MIGRSRLIAWVSGFVVFGSVSFLLFAEVNQRTGGELRYVLDDAYIHLSMARSFADSGVWGPCPDGGFVPVSSAPLFTALLGVLMAVVGPEQGLTRGLEVAASVGVLWLGAGVLHRHLHGALAAITLPLVVLAVPLPLLVVLGMEHALHTLAVVALVLAGGRLLAEDDDRLVMVALLAGIATGVRYESCAVVALLGVVLLARRRWRASAVILLSGACVPAIMGIASLQAGWFFAPTGLVTKAAIMLPQTGAAERWWLNLQTNLGDAPALGWGGLALLLALLSAPPDRALRWQMGLALGVTLTHLIFGTTGWYYRYEAYLYGVLALWVPAGLGGERTGRWQQGLRIAAALVALWAGVLSGQRTAEALDGVSQLAADLHSQNAWAGPFFARHFPEARLVTHDLGLIAWYTRELPVDLAGLASRDFAEILMSDRRDLREVEAILTAEEGKVAWTFSYWFESAGFGAPPPNWVPVATLETEGHGRQLGSAHFTFWAIGEAQVPALRAALVEELEHNSLPARVRLSWGR